MADEQNLIKDTLFTDEEILDHDYDGIKEMNNGMPFWLTGLFLGSIIFGVIYYLHYTSGAGITIWENYQADLKSHDAKIAAIEEQNQDVDFFAQLNNPEGVAYGAEVYKIRCAACHGDAGQGGIGPNLTDNYWIHGDGSVKTIAEVVDKGVTEKGMPAWGPVLGMKDVVAATYFIESIKGTNPAGAKEPQGQEYK